MTRARRGLRAETMDARGRPLRVPGLAAWLSRVAPASAKGSVGIALVSDARMRALNRQFRHRDAVTDVLSFAEQPRPEAQSPKSFLGDIVIGRDAARRQARMAGHSELTELRVLALHGLLHLMGYDHHGESQSMAQLERRLRRKGGLREGLIERAHRP